MPNRFTPTRPVIAAIGPSIAYIQLTRGQFSCVDDVDVEAVSKHNWFAAWNVNSSVFYAVRNVRLEDGVRIRVQMHDQISPPKSGYIVDHRNLSSLDNRRANHREATHQENICNRSIPKSNTSGFKGVCRKGNRWIAQIKTNNKRHALGYFMTPEEAYAAYCAAAKRLHGEFARLI